MQILLTILIATVASQVQSTGFACSKSPLLSKMYDLAQKISGWKTSVEPKAGTEKSFQDTIDKIILFKKNYEAAEYEVNCKSLLCDQKSLLSDYARDFFHQNLRSDPPYWSNIHPDYRVVLEDYYDLVGRGVYNLSSAYCQAAGPILKQLAQLAENVDKMLTPYYANDLTNLEGEIRVYLIDRYKHADETRCRYLDPQFLDCFYLNHHRGGLKRIPQEVKKQVYYLHEICEKTVPELESMKGFELDC